MKKSADPPDFNFDESEELRIYTYAMYKLKREKSEFRKIKEKYVTYDEWKNSHVVIKYQNLSLKSLSDVNRMLNRRHEKTKAIIDRESVVIVPMIVLLITLYISFLNIGLNPYVNFAFALVMVLWIIIHIIRDLAKEDEKKYLYQDYIEIINEMIKKRRL